VIGPQRIQLHRTGGWRKPEGAIVVARPNRWGNPYAYRTHTALARVPALDGSAWEYEDRISADGMRHDYFHADGHRTVHHVRWMTRQECVDLHRLALTEPTAQLHLYDRRARQVLTVEMARAELAGRDLCCWCKPGQPCHVDVLLAIANPAVAAAPGSAA
jgi:hypothetical protein